jgi:SAM-dependent methyltransferase
MRTDPRSAYDALAPYYDRFTDGYAHPKLVGALAELARDHGLSGDRALDVACGTGKSSEPLAGLGYEVSGCDISPQMVERAQERLGSRRTVFVADMRSLPDVGPFDLITCLDDSVNYLLSVGDLRRSLRSMAARLRPGGQVIFDTNTIGTYRHGFSADFVMDSGDTLFCWRGRTASNAPAGSVCEATLEVFERRDHGAVDRVTSAHRQRHHAPDAVREAIATAGLRLRAVRGMLPGGALSGTPNEEVQPKLVYLAERPGT